MHAPVRSALRPLRLVAVLLCVAPVAMAAARYIWGPEPSHTGAPAVAGHPAEELCTECHLLLDDNNDPRPNLNLTAGKLEILDVPALYAPGQTYPLRVRLSCDSTATDPDRDWGFEMTCVRDADGEGTGTFDVTGRTDIQVVAGFEPGWESRTYVEHTMAGVHMGEPSPVEWTIQWVAPASGTGPVHFYCAGNAGNGSYDTLGDWIFTTSATSTEAPVATRRVSWADLKLRYR